MKIAIAGDISITKNSYGFFANADEKSAFNSVPEIFKDCDRVIVNLECALTESENAIRKFGPNLKGPKATADTLVKIGVTDCALSNNHIFDFGIEGVEDTFLQLERTGLKWTGFGDNYDNARKDHVIEQDGIKITVINVCEHEYTYATENRMGARVFDPFETMDDIRQAKKKSDYVIVIYHGGKEFCKYPSPRLLKASREMIRCGADVVLCQHSHCIGCYEKFEGGHILYGQGNFHFAGHLKTDGWETGLVALLYITKDSLSIDFVPTIEDGRGGIDLAKGEDKDAIINGFTERSKALQNGEWRKYWSEFCQENAPRYRAAICGYNPDDDADKTQLFAHYLDCEAHTDVWRELFYTWNKTNETEAK